MADMTKKLDRFTAAILAEATAENERVMADLRAKRKAAYDKASATSNFTLSDGCDGCGVCADVCPDRIISMENGRPAWNADSCTLCLACLHRCPRTAIDLGESTMGKRRYVNPRTDMPVGPI